MTKPTVPADLMPSAILCYPAYTLSPEARRLVESCQEILKVSNWDQIDQVVFDWEQLDPSQDDRCERVIIGTYLADTCWLAGRYGQAQRYYREAEEAFSTRCELEHRQNEAAATYGQGLVHQAKGFVQEAQRFYNQTLRLLQRSQSHWGIMVHKQRFAQCNDVAEQIEHLKKLCLDSPMPPLEPKSTHAEQHLSGIHPLILGAIPAGGSRNVPIDTPLLVTFSRPMQTSSLDIRIEPGDHLGEMLPILWRKHNTIALVRSGHSTLDYSTEYTIKITNARSQDGSLLKDGYASRSWSFITASQPDREVEVLRFFGAGSQLPGNAPIVIAFNQPMDPDKLQLEIEFKQHRIQVRQDRIRWDKTGTVAILDHPGIAVPKSVTLSIAKSVTLTITRAVSQTGQVLSTTPQAIYTFLSSVPYASTPPLILDCSPPPGQQQVPINLPIVVLFSKSVKSVDLDFGDHRPPSTHEEWLLNRSLLILEHSNFLFGQKYEVTIDGQDRDGLALPTHAWTFAAEAKPRSPSEILGVSPMDGAEDVPQTVCPVLVFTQPMDTAPGRFRWSSPASQPLSSVEWDLDSLHRIAIIDLIPPLQTDSDVLFTVSTAFDIHGNNVVAAQPYSWRCETESVPPSPPTIVHEFPRRGSTDVKVDRPIWIFFSEPMDPNTFEYDIEPQVERRGIEWQRSNRTAIIHHGGFLHSETYTITIKQARAQREAASLTDAAPVCWSFSTRDRRKSPIQYTYPAHHDINIPPDASLILGVRQPITIQDFIVTESGPQNRRWLREDWTQTQSIDRSRISVSFQEGLSFNSEIEVKLHGVRDENGRPVDLSEFPTPWRFRTTDLPLHWRHRLDGLDVALLIAALILAITVALGMIFLVWTLVGEGSLERGWWRILLAGLGYLAAFATMLMVIPWYLRHRGILFSVPDGHQALIQQNARFRIVKGPSSYAWRVPFSETLRAVVPLHPILFRISDCKLTVGPDNEEIELVLEVQYRIFSSIDAFACFEHSSEDRQKKSTVASTKDLQAVWEQNLRKLVTSLISDRLRNMPKQKIIKHRSDIEEETLQVLNVKACHWGIEIQDFELVEIKPAKGA